MRISSLLFLSISAMPVGVGGQAPPTPVAPAAPVAASAPASVVSPAPRAARLSTRPAMDASLAQVPPEAQGKDPADSLYRMARQALNRNDYRRSAELFQSIRGTYPKSAYVPDAYYWEAYARYRRGGDEALRMAAALLAQQAAQYPNASTRKAGDARSLEARIQGELARGGDEAAARTLTGYAERAAPVAAAPRPSRPPRGTEASDACRESEDDVQATALHALMQMDADRALPILKKVLARRDEGSTCLRRKAVFLVSQHETSETGTMLLNTARTDPDLEVRSQAVFWLSQVDAPGAVAALDSIAASSKEPELQEKAIFALSQQEAPEAHRALRRFAERSDISTELRSRTVFWLSQSDDPEDTAWLKSLYGRTIDPELKERVLFSLSQRDDPAVRQFLLDVARNAAEPVETRKKALFWLGQRDETTGADLAGLYATFSDREIKQQLLFALSRKEDKAALDKLIDIARREPDKELRKKAIFWLGQSNDPRVAEILAELLEKP